MIRVACWISIVYPFTSLSSSLLPPPLLFLSSCLLSLPLPSSPPPADLCLLGAAEEYIIEIAGWRMRERVYIRYILLSLLLLLLPSSTLSWEYLGCYKDEYAAGSRDLVGSLLLNEKGDNLITPDYCENYCGSRQFKYVGVQYGSECWCGNSYGRHGQLEEEKCHTPCVGDPTIVNRCGGELANSVFKITKKFAAPPPHPNDGRPLLALVMIVKDEAHTLGNTLSTLAPFLDYYYILDTGSTDGTQKKIREVLGPRGEVWEEPFIDYGRSRNRVLEIAEKSKNPPIFCLMLSADETVHNPQALRSFCELHRDAEGAMHEAYPIQMDVGWKFDSVRLSRTDKGWRYVGRVHEYLAAPDLKWRPSLRVPDAWIQFRVTDPERRGQREYKIRDILLEEVREKPTDTRASFYLARTYNVIGNHSAALVEFQRRIALGGWQEEVYESYYAIAFQIEALGRPWAEVHQAFLDAHNHSPERGEPLYNIAQHYYQSPNHKNLAYMYAEHCSTLPYPKDAVLWVQADVYNWQCNMLVGLTGYMVKKHVEGYTGLLKALQKQPNDQAMINAKPHYESVLNPTQRKEAECKAGIKTGPECNNQGTGIPSAPAKCNKKHVDELPSPSPPPSPSSLPSPSSPVKSSLAERVTKEPALPEPSIWGADVGEEEAGSGEGKKGRYGSLYYMPKILRDKYVWMTEGASESERGRNSIILGFILVLFLGCCVVLPCFYCVGRRCPCRPIQLFHLRLFGGKKGVLPSSSHSYSAGGGSVHHRGGGGGGQGGGHQGGSTIAIQRGGALPPVETGLPGEKIV